MRQRSFHGALLGRGAQFVPGIVHYSIHLRPVDDTACSLMRPTSRRAGDLSSRFEAMLDTTCIGRPMRAFETLTSTNSLAAAWEAEGAPHGALVFAEYQTQGRGRLGRTWTAGAGLNLMFSVVLRPEIPVERFGLIIIAASVALAEVVENAATPIRAGIKWPNDILLSGRKCCGMLLESSHSTSKTSRPPAVVLGVGLNVNQDTFPDELTERATSILLETGRTTDRAHLLAAICRQLESRFSDSVRNSRDIRRQYLTRMPDLGEAVRLQFSGTKGGINGVVVGIDETGGLVLQTDAGPRTFHAGEVTRSRG